ncbi:MAG TPA: SH3 domain-containing protein, partial [Candidatus Blautia stercoravium]|nr:SH3 domain-containing protein [Candidatus Blautia stercoravium]
MLDNFREWLSDNLRYILLGLAILLVLVLLFFGVKALTRGSSDGKTKDTDKKTEQKKDSTDSDKAEK